MIRVGEVKADGTSTLAEAVGLYDMAKLGEGDLHPELDAKLKRLAESFTTAETSARFKLEVFFKGGMRKTVPVRGIIAFWTNGGFLNGGGDAAVYLCPQPTETGLCLSPIDMQFATPKHAVCTVCRRLSETKDLVGQILTEVPLPRWSMILTRLFHQLECNADIRICMERGSMHAASRLELEGYRAGEAYADVQKSREWITYSLANIIKDTASGAGLETRIRAFLEA